MISFVDACAHCEQRKALVLEEVSKKFLCEECRKKATENVIREKQKIREDALGISTGFDEKNSNVMCQECGEKELYHGALCALCADCLNKRFSLVQKANNNKIPMELIDMEFVAAMADVFGKGLKNGREPNDWQDLSADSETFARYKAKILRHLLEAERCFDAGDLDEASGHAASIGCNANILHFLFQHIE